MGRLDIIRQIDVTVFSGSRGIDRWSIGVTQDLETTTTALAESGVDLANLHSWNAENVREAESVRDLFMTLGMQSSNQESDDGAARIVYLF
ncbi:MAG: hypothetical protein KJO98_04275 [Rhodothermia bacterium]|nr:hypothetical protein [Rhodothermia bacterium]